MAGFRLDDGVYNPIPGDDRDLRYSEQLGLYLGVHAGRLRYFDRKGALIATPAETAQQEHRRAETLAARLRALGVDPDSVK